jgi:pimeloyl-ACP methyl ester carboxylesterase
MKKLKFKVKIPFLSKFVPKKILKNKILLFSTIGIVIAVIGFFVYLSLKPKTSQQVVLLAEVQTTAGALERGDKALITPISTSTSDYTSAEVAASFVGNMYKLTWKSGLNTMARAPIHVWLPIPPNYYFGQDAANVQAVELIDGMPYILYGGQIRTQDGKNYLECITYFPGIIGLVLTNTKSEYGIRLVRKVSDNAPNLVIIPGSNMNFAGNIPGTNQNIWAQNFPNYNVYLFTYPLVNSRSLSTTEKIMNYFMKTGSTSYVKYTARNLVDLLSTVKGEIYIVAQGIGGLIAREAVQDQNIQAKKVVLFDTPNEGTSFASSYMLSNLYNAGDIFTSRELSLPQKTVNYIMNMSISYLRLLNFFAQDVEPNSPLLTELNSRKIPSKVTFISISGSKPNVNLQTSKKMEEIFPQLAPKKGDGVVSLKSALSFGDKKYEFPYSFYDIFVHKEVQDLLKGLLSSSALKVKEKFISDKFKETKVSTSPTQVIHVKIRPHIYLSQGDYYLKNPMKGSFLAKSFYIPVPHVSKIMGTENGVYLVSPEEVYFMSIGGYQPIYKGKVAFTNVYNGKMYLTTPAKQVLEFEGKISKLKATIPDEDYQSVFSTDKDVYALVNTATATIFIDLTSHSDLLTIPGKNAILRYFPLSDEFAIVTDKYVALYNNTMGVGTFFEKTSSIMKEIGFRSDQSIKIDSVYIDGDLIYLLSSNYVLIAVDVKTHKAQIIGNQNVGNLKLLSYGDILTVIGERTLNFYDLKNRVRIPIYQLTDGVLDAAKWNNTILLLCDKEGKYEVDGYVKK